MAGSASEDNGVGRSSEGLLSSQRCQSGDSQGEWRSSEQLESGTPSTSPPYWDTDEDDDGPKPSDLYGKFTWKIENFSQISKRELRSNAFEVGGYKWYILIYPQGCDVCNHLSLFLCVANHDKLLPGWSHFAQFTIAVVNKDPKKSKYSDTLHRFWKKEHDWGWKKFMELSKVSDGFIVSDTLVIKAQVQVIREKADRPFRCLDCQYRRELVRVYLSNVEKICRTFVEERRGKLGTLIEDKVRWSSFRSFWLGIDQNARCRMSREKMDAILKVVVRHFFIEKEVTSTLVMDSLYSGLKALECQSTNKKGRAKVEMDEMPAPIVNVDKDMFVLADDVLLLLERAAVEPLPPKDDKGPQNRTKDGTSGEEFTKDSIDREERRLTELGRRTVEIFVLAHIFSNQIEVAYQEAVALKRQEELIREEEAAGLAENELKAKRGVAEKEKRIKKKQAKQRRSSRKGKDRGREEKLDLMVQEKHHGESPSSKRNLDDFPVKQARSVLEKHDTLEDISNVSDTADDVSEAPRPDLDDRDACSVYWDTDTSEIHPSTEASSSSVSYLPVQNGGAEKKNPSVMDDSSSTCSTDSVPSVVMNGPYKGNLPNYKGLTSPIRGKKQRNKDTRQQSSWVQDTCNPQLDASSDVGTRRDAAGSCPGDEPESEAFLHSLKDRIQWLEQHLVQKQEEVVSLQQKLSVKDQVDVDGCPKQKTAEVSSSPSSPMRTMPSRTQPKQAVETTAVEPGPIRQASSSSPSQQEKAIPMITRPPHIISTSKPDTQKPANPLKATSVLIEKNAAQQVSAMSRPSSAPLIPAPVLNAPVVSMVQTAPSLSRSVSAAGRLGADSLPVTQVTHSYVPLSYRNAITGRNLGTSSATFTSRPPSSSSSPSVSYSQPPALASPSLLSPQSSARKDHISSGFTFGNVLPGVLHNQPQWMERSQHEANGMVCGPSLLNDIANIDIYGSGRGAPQTFYANELRAGSSARQSQGTSADEFPHLDIINSLFDEEQGTGKAGPAFSASNNGYHHHHTLNRQFTFPGDAGTTDVGSSINCCRLDHTARYPDDGIDRIYGSSSRPYSGLREVGSQVGLSGYSNGQVDGMIQNQWPVDGSDLSLLGMGNMEGDGYPFQLPDYSNLACGISGFGLFRPANGH